MTEVQKRAYALADLDRGDLMLAQAFANAGATSSSRHHLDDDRRRRNDHGAARLPHRDVVETGNDSCRFESSDDDHVAFDAQIG